MESIPQLTVLLTDAQLERLADLVVARLPQAAPAMLVTDEQPYYTVKEAAAHLHVNPQTIYNAVAAGQLTRHLIGRGREYRINPAELRQYINKGVAA